MLWDATSYLYHLNSWIMKVKKQDGKGHYMSTNHAKMNPEKMLTDLVRRAVIRAVKIVKNKMG